MAFSRAERGAKASPIRQQNRREGQGGGEVGAMSGGQEGDGWGDCCGEDHTFNCKIGLHLPAGAGIMGVSGGFAAEEWRER